MKFDRGTIFLTIASLILIALLITLAAAIVTGPAQPSLTPGDDEGELLGEIGSQPESARPIMKDPNYPGISTTYSMDGSSIGLMHGLGGEQIFGKELKLNNDGTLTISCDYRNKVGTIGPAGTYTVGHWYKIKGKGHAIYFTVGGTYTQGSRSISINEIGGTATIVNKNGRDFFDINGVRYTGGSYNDWDAGYSDMGMPVDRLGLYIDCGIPAVMARPYVEKGLDGDHGVPYMQYNIPPETADYFAKRGISGDICGPYYAAGVSPEDTMAYLDSGFTADLIMPYVHAGVPESDILTYLNAGAAYDRAKPYINANATASAAAPYAASTFSADQCMPFVNAGTDISNARPFMFLNIPSDQAIVYISNDISATRAKPYVDAGVPAEKAVGEIRQGIPPTV